MEHLTRFSLEYPKTTLAVLLLITAVLGAGAPRVQQAYGARVLIGNDHPAIRALDSLIAEFAGGHPARVVDAAAVLPPPFSFGHSSLARISGSTSP